MLTWHFESLVVATILLVVNVSVHRGINLVEVIGSCAVLFSFMHASVAERLAEREAQRNVKTVHCYRWLTRYFVAKEIGWFVYFLVHHAWSALVGVIVFLLYPVWRRYYRTTIKPLDV